MAHHDEFEIGLLEEGAYAARVPSVDGVTTFTLVLNEIADASAGVLSADEATARATVAFLLTHQDAADLPGRVEFTDVVAAYPDAVERIAALRG